MIVKKRNGITMSNDVMMYINIGILVLYVFYLISGWRKGFLLQVANLVGMILSFYFAWRYSDVVSTHIHLLPKDLAPFQDTIFKEAAFAFFNQIICFIALFLVFKIVFYFIEKLISSIQEIPFLKQISGLLGALVGGIVATFWILMVCVVLRLPLIKDGNAMIEQTYLGTIYDTATTLFGEVGGPSLTTEAFNHMYTNAKNMDDSDQKAVDQWLRSHGYEYDINK